MSIPPLFRCPISLELFNDPVTLCTGQTYDRPSIEKWISSGNLTCPVTMQRLHDLSMVPNRTLSHLIHLWLNQTAHSTAPTDAYLVALKQTLESPQPTWEKKLQALKHLNTLPNVDDHSLLRFGFFQILINLAFEGGEEELAIGASCTHQRLELLELALTYAVKLVPSSDLACLKLLQKESKFAALSTLLEKGTPLIKILICNILGAVLTSSSNETKELSTMIRASDDIQRSVINLTYSEDENLSEEAVKVILAFSTESKGAENLVQAGAIRGLTRHILRADGGSTAAAAALEALSAAEGGKEAVLREDNGVKALVKMVFRVSDHQGSESALNGLMCLCGGGSAAAREAVVKAGVLTQLLLLIQSQCGWQVKVKARALLRMLGNVWPDQEYVDQKE